MASTHYDYYEILGVSRGATCSEIKKAYRKLSIQNHPDKNLGDEEAAGRFALISQAYAVLSDPTKRHTYDTQGSVDISDLTVNVNELGILTKLTFGFFNRMGLKVTTEISPKILSDAKSLINETSGSSVEFVEHGKLYSCKGTSQSGEFFRIEITEDDLKKGLVVQCWSTNRDRFKVIFFDQNGDVAMMEESESAENKTEVSFRFLPFSTYHLSTDGALANKEKDWKPLFSMLEFYSKSTHSIQAGKHLFCVYQNNWYNNGVVKLSVITPRPEDPGIVYQLQKIESLLADRKEEVSHLKSEYINYRDKIKDIEEKVDNLTDDTKNMIRIREEFYERLLGPTPTEAALVPTNKKQGFLNRFF